MERTRAHPLLNIIAIVLSRFLAALTGDDHLGVVLES
jgi:hypothetical protein